MENVFAPARLNQLKIKIFVDGADVNQMVKWSSHPDIEINGFTTNPSLMRSAGIVDYEQFGRKVLENIVDFPVSFEVFSDDLKEMEKQARYIATWGNNLNVKIPVTNTAGCYTGEVISRLSADGIPLNITAVMTYQQVEKIVSSLDPSARAIISIFAGRIADTGVDPMPLMKQVVDLVRGNPNIEILWASTREILNIVQADAVGCHIITVPYSLLGKVSLLGFDLDLYSLETVKQFSDDAIASGFNLDPATEASLLS